MDGRGKPGRDNRRRATMRRSFPLLACPQPAGSVGRSLRLAGDDAEIVFSRTVTGGGEKKRASPWPGEARSLR